MSFVANEVVVLTLYLNWQFFGLLSVPWELSSQSLASLALGSKTRLVKRELAPSVLSVIRDI